MYRLTLVFFALLFLVFRPFQLERPGMLFPGDDFSYFAFASSMAFGEYPFFEKEYVEEFRVPPLSRVGPALMMLPFVTAGSVVDRILRHPIVEQRTRSNILSSWALFGAVFAAGFYAWLGVFLLYRALRRLVSRPTAQWAVACCALAPMLILYAYRRPVFSHAYEFFLQSAFLYLFINKQSQSRWRRRIGESGVAALTAALCALTLAVRQNAALFALIWPFLILCAARWKLTLDKPALARLAVALGAGWGLFLAIKYFPWFFQKEKYAAANAAFETAGFLWKWHGLWFYVKRAWTVLFGADWGLLYTAPHLLLGFAAVFLLKRKEMSRCFQLLAVPILVNFYICLIWMGQGSWYGYRYFVFPATPVLCCAFAVWWEESLEWREEAKAWMIALIALPLASALVFEATPSTLLHGVVTEFGERNVGHLTYQIEVWKGILENPLYFFQSVLKGGPSYVVYLLGHLLGIARLLPQRFSALYPAFSVTVLIQTFLLYVTPWLLYLAFCTGKQPESRK